MDTLAKAFGLLDEAHSDWQKSRYQDAKGKCEEAKRALTTFMEEAEDQSSVRKVQKVISDIDEEISAIRREELQKDNFLATLRRSYNKEAPPSDPQVWEPPTTKPPSLRKTAPTNPKRMNGKPPVDRERKTVKPPLPSDASGSGNADSAEQERNAIYDKYLISGGYEKGHVDTVLAMITKETSVTWDDIVGLEDCKEVFRQTVILPSLMPDYFKGIRRPSSGILLFGPPGTGKTLLAKAVATERKSQCFIVQTADLISKWRGDSEKLLKLIFDMARENSPSTIFFDEIDSIAGQRGNDNEHEASRRLKSQLLIEMDGFSTSDARVLVLGTTNLPWQLDEAFRRRFETRLYIGLPSAESRKALLQCIFDDECPLAENVDLDAVAESLEGYSPADIKIVCRKAALAGVTRFTKGLSTQEIQNLPPFDIIPVTIEDVEEAIGNIRPSVDPATIPNYTDWATKFGSG